MQKAILFFVFQIVCTFSILSGQSNSNSVAEFYVETSAKEVIEGGYFELRLVMKNMKATNFQPPSFSDFDILNGPSRQTSVQIINGVRNSSLTMAYVLRPKKRGVLTIGSAQVTYANKTYKTKPLRIKVVKGSSTEGQSQAPLALFQAELSDSVAFPGQQVQLDYVLFVKKPFMRRNQSIDRSIQFPGFYVEGSSYYTDENVILNGVEYHKYVIERFNLFPQKSGLLTVPGNIINGSIVNANEVRGFFSSSMGQTITLKSEPLTLEVLPLPNTPEHFCGVIGPVNFEWSANKTQLTTDETIKLKLTVTTTADQKRIQAPTLPISKDSFEILAPKIISEAQDEARNGAVIYQRVFEYQIIPNYPGSYSLDLYTDYYFPDSSQFLRSPNFELDLKVARGNTISDENINIERNSVTSKIEFAENLVISPSKLKRTSGLGKSIPHLLFFTPLLFVFGFYLKKKYSDDIEEELQAEGKRQAAENELFKSMDRIQKNSEEKTLADQYQDLQKELQKFIAEKYNQGVILKDKNSINQLLADNHWSPENIRFLNSVLQSCEMMRFGGIGDANQLKVQITTIKDILK